VVPKRNLRWRMVGVRKKAELLETWQADILRHSYCSHWLAAYGDLNRLRANVGHRSPDLLFRHYHKAVRKAEAKKFWQIKPSAQLAKIRTIA